MWHDSSVLRYQCWRDWRDWRDYMNEDSGVMIVRMVRVYF